MKPPMSLTWTIGRDAWEAAAAELRGHGRRGHEGIAFWLGVRELDQIIVRAVVVPRGDGVLHLPDHVSVGHQLINDLTDLCIERGEMLVAQIHSHGPWHGVNLSPLDRREGFQTQDFLSIVAPDYAQRTFRLGECGVHVYVAPRGYRRLSSEQVAERVRVSEVPSVRLEIGGAQ